MSVVNKGSHGFTVTVSLEPDLSGNFVCDGTDDDIQIQQAIDYVGDLGGGIIHIKRGTYDIDATLVDTGVDNITICGDHDATILRAKNSLNNRVFLLTGVDNWVIKDLKIDGNAPNQSEPNGNFPNGIEIQTGEHCLIENVTCYNCRMYGIWFRTGTYHTARNCKVINAQDYGSWNGIFLGADFANGGPLGDSFRVENCYVEGAADIGIAIGTDNAHIIGNYCYYNSNLGGSSNPAVTHGQAIKVEAGSYNVVQDNYIYYTATSAMDCNHASYCVFDGNWIQEWEQEGGGDYGSWVNEVDYITFRNNTWICDNGSALQLEQNCDDCEIKDNTFIVPNNTGLHIANANDNDNFVDGNNFNACTTDVNDAGTNTIWGANLDQNGNWDQGVEP